MSRLVFHTLHIVVDNFADSLEEELGTIAKEDQLWYDIKLVRDINPYRQGLGLYAVFYDEDKQNNLQDRMKKLAEKILSSRNRIMEIGYWPETTRDRPILPSKSQKSSSHARHLLPPNQNGHLP